MKFEEAYNLLETILEKMNTGKLSLEESMELYEQAHALVRTCESQLTDAEKKIEIMVKNRQGQPISNDSGSPATEPFKL